MKSKKGRVSEKDNNKKQCVRCNKVQNAIREFYNADEFLYPDGKFCICKTCVEEIVELKGFDGFITVLRAMNRPFIQEYWNNDYKDYIRQISSLKQYKGLTFDDSIFDNNKLTKASNEDRGFDKEEDDIVITPSMRRFWRGYSDEEIKILESYYQDLTSTYECETPVQRTLYRNMAITQYKADNAKNSTEFQRLMKTLSDLMNDANVKPVQESGVNDTGLSTWGEWVRKIEETEPIPEPSEEFKDVDRIKKYIDKWFVKHFAKIFGLLSDSEREDDKIEHLKGDN